MSSTCDTGRVLTEENMLEDIRLMKRHNINAVRYLPLSQRFPVV